jgi:hypothetical protein
MTDPLKTFDSSGRPKLVDVSQKAYAIAGISVTVFGLEELPAQAADVACLWLLHPRLATQERMTSIASATITDWNNKNRGNLSAKGLIAVSFDQRNHGTRMVDPLANEAWKQGNPRHAQDMFSIFRKCPKNVLGGKVCTNHVFRGHCSRHIAVDGLPRRVRLPQW